MPVSRNLMAMFSKLRGLKGKAPGLLKKAAALKMQNMSSSVRRLGAAAAKGSNKAMDVLERHPGKTVAGALAGYVGVHTVNTLAGGKHAARKAQEAGLPKTQARRAKGSGYAQGYVSQRIGEAIGLGKLGGKIGSKGPSKFKGSAAW